MLDIFTFEIIVTSVLTREVFELILQLLYLILEGFWFLLQLLFLALEILGLLF